MTMESKTTSKTSSLKALLLKAWRERWTDLQWGINIKTVLPRGVSGDVYNLADCILQQAIVGAGANQLVLSYLRHSLSAQLVSHAAVLQRLSKYNQFKKVHCLYSLLEFLEGMLPGVTCCGRAEESVLANSIQSIVNWLLLVFQQCSESVKLKLKAIALFQQVINNDFYVSMICLAKYSQPEMNNEIKLICSKILSGLDEKDEMYAGVKKLELVDVTSLSLASTSEKWPGSLIQCWLSVKLVGNPGTSTSQLLEPLRLFQKLKGYDNPRLYAELIRGSLLSFFDVHDSPHESQWGAFTFLKVPPVLLELSEKNDSQSIVAAVELLLQHSPLLDAMNANSPCSIIEGLLSEFVKIHLMSEVQVKHLLEKRKVPQLIQVDTVYTTAGIPKVVNCAVPTLTGILRTLAPDYEKTPLALLNMLHQMFTSNNFHLILAVASVNDQLPKLVVSLIRVNEAAKSGGGDKTIAQLFDTSFLMLVAIVQTYGVVVLDLEGDSFFNRWVRNCMVERYKPKASEQLLRLGDSAAIEQLLQQFNAGESDFKSNVTWEEVMFNMAGVMHEVLVAWEQGTLAPADVKRILDAIRGRMCCLPLAAAAWLCAYMRTAPQENVLKPINMVQQLLAAPAGDDEVHSKGWELTCEIIRKMQKDVQLPLQTKSSNHLMSRQPATEEVHTAWCSAIERGWLDHNSGRSLHCLLHTAGARWLVSAIVQELVKMRFRDDLQRGVDLALAIFHVNIVACTLELVSHVLPQILYNGNMQANALMDPQMLALANLTCSCIYTAYEESFEVMNENNEFIPEEIVTDEPEAKMPRINKRTTNKLISSLKNLLQIFEEHIREGYITQQTYFALYLIKSLIEIKVVSSTAIIAAIPSALITDLLRTLPELFSYSVIIRLHDVLNCHGRSNMAKDLCILRNYHIRNVLSE